MKNCKIVQDLMPNYIEKLTSEESNTFIEEHLKTCDNCTQILDSMKTDIKLKKTETPKEEIEYMKKAKKKMNIAKKLLILIIIVIIALILLFCRDIYKIYAYIDIQNKFNKTVEEANNYMIVSTGLGLENMYTYFYKDGRAKMVSNDLRDGTEVISWDEYTDNKIISYYTSNKDYMIKTCIDKSPLLRRGIQDLSISQMILGEVSKWEEFKLNISSIDSISSTKYKGYMPSYLVRTNSKDYYVSKETGCILNDESREYVLKYDVVTDEQIDFPNEKEDYIVLLDEVGDLSNIETEELGKNIPQISNCDKPAGTIVDYDFKVLNEESENLSELKKSETQENLSFIKIVNKETYDRYKNKWKNLRELTEEDFKYYFALIVIDKNNQEEISFNSIQSSEITDAIIKIDKKEAKEDYKYSGSLIILPRNNYDINIFETDVEFMQ